MKKIITAFLTLTLTVSMVACGSGNNSPAEPTPPPEPPVLTGEWTESDPTSTDTYMTAIITDTAIEIYWFTPAEEMKALYWAGTFTAPTTAEEPYTWTSENDKEKTNFALLASGDDTKIFTYKDGKFSYELSAMGVTKTVYMEKSK